MSLKKLPNKTYPALGISIADRAVKEAFAKRCSMNELEELRQHFLKKGPLQCTYCGEPDPTRWDHIHPISEGGDTVKGNLIPACGACDDSKQHRSLLGWFSSKSKKKPPVSRHAGIHRAIAEHRESFPYVDRQFQDKLDEKQKLIYQEFKKRIASLREFLKTNGITTK